MSEARSRPSAPRGRGSTRSGRGGYNGRGRGGNRQTNGAKVDALDHSSPTLEDEGEIGELKSKFSSQLSTLKEMFPDWTNEDLVFALQETDGDLESTIGRISEGNVSQWGEVKKKTKDRSQSKAKDSVIAGADMLAPSTRGGRGRGGSDTARGPARGRSASDRGRGGSRAGRGARAPPSSSKINGTSTTNEEGSALSAASGTLDDSAPADASTSPLDSGWEHVSADSTSQAPEESKASSKPDGSKSWASMFAKPKLAPAPPKVPKSAPTNEAPVETPIAAPPTSQDGSMQGLPPPVTVNDTSEIPNTPPATDLATSEQAADLTPTKDDLTETNLEKLPDISGPVTSATAASTAASTLDQRGFSGAPLVPAQPVTTSRPPMGGYATTAYKATGMPGRTPSYQRKILEQQEAVVMPGKHAVDKAAVQFGSMGLNGTPEDVDVDSDREDPETRVQPPQHSPVAPRASLPPAPLQLQQQQQQGLPQPPIQEPHATPRQAPGLPPVSQPLATQAPPQQSGAENQASLPSSYPPYDQFGGDRYAPSAARPEAPPSTKSYEPFGQQLQQSQQYDPFSNAGSSSMVNESRQFSNEKYGSGPSNMSSYYTSDDQRSGYQNSQYGAYGQHQQNSGPEPAGPQQRSGSALGSSAAVQPSQYPTAPGRFGQGAEAHSSGQSTPYGSMSNQQSNTHPHHMSQQGQGPGQHGGFGYGGYPYGGYYSSYNMNQVSAHPYGRDRSGFDDPRRYEDQYLTQNPQYGYGGQGGYGGGPFGGAAGGKGLYGQHQHPAYGMSPQTSHDQQHSTASPANAGPFGQQLPGSGRDSAANTGGLGGFGARSGSAQPNDSMPEIFGRSQSSYQGGQSLGGNTSGNDDALRSGYGDTSKMPGGRALQWVNQGLVDLVQQPTHLRCCHRKTPGMASREAMADTQAIRTTAEDLAGVLMVLRVNLTKVGEVTAEGTVALGVMEGTTMGATIAGAGAPITDID